MLKQKTEDSLTNVLSKLSNTWQKKSAVCNLNEEVCPFDFDSNKKDFRESLLPFHQHDAWVNAPSSLKDTCLSYAWGIYNLKTVYIECDIVTPACEDFLKSSPMPSSNVFMVQEVIAEALLDEALHTKMSIMASNFIYQKRNLQPLSNIQFNLIKWRDYLLKKCTSDSTRRTH